MIVNDHDENFLYPDSFQALLPTSYTLIIHSHTFRLLSFYLFSVEKAWDGNESTLLIVNSSVFLFEIAEKSGSEINM